jgi:hypothetical protein
MKETGINIPYDEITAMQKRWRTGPISISITIDNYRLTWALGPDKDGTYSFLPGPISGVYYGKSLFPSSGSMMIGENPGGEIETTYFRIVREMKDGEEVVSPEFVVRLPGTQTIEYYGE